MNIIAASFYFTGPILIRCSIYIVIFKFNLIKSRVMVRLGLGLRVGVRVLWDLLLLVYSPVVLPWIRPVNYNCPHNI